MVVCSTIRDDFGTSMPFKSSGGVHLIICGAKVGFASFFLMPQPPLLYQEGSYAPLENRAMIVLGMP